MQQVKGAVQAAGEALKGASATGQAYKGGGSARAGSSAAGGARGGEKSSGAGGGAGNSGDESFHDEELSFIEPVFATRTAIHPAPQRELPQVRGEGLLEAAWGRRESGLVDRAGWLLLWCLLLKAAAGIAPLQKTMPAYMAKVRAPAGAAPSPCVPL